jgi:hypothetical protein
MSLGFPVADELGLHDDEVALFEFFLRLGFLRGKLEEEFESAFDAWSELVEIEDALASEWAAMRPEPEASESSRPFQTLVMNIIYTPGLSAGELREEACRLRAESAAGSLILMLDDVIQRLRHEVLDSTGAPSAVEFRLGDLLGGSAHLTTLVYAAGNAYRHAKDWEGLVNSDGAVDQKHLQYKRAKKTLAVLDDTVGLDAVVGRNVCVASLSLLSLAPGTIPSFDLLWSRLEDVAVAFADEYCSEEDSYERVCEALEYQAAYNSIEASFSMNERLFHRSEPNPSEPNTRDEFD